MSRKLSEKKDGVFAKTSSMTMKEKMGYAGGIFGNCMGQDSTDTYGDKFCRNFMGISTGGMLLKSNITTAVGFLIPPVAGAWYDSPSRGKMSNLRKAIMIAPIPFAITSMLLFIVPTTNAFYNFIWALFMSIVFSISDTFFDIAMSALGLKLCSDPKDRKNFFTFSSLASTLGSMLPGWVIPIVVRTANDDLNRQKWLYFFTALGFCIIGLATMYAPFLTIRDRAEGNREELLEKKRREAAANGKRAVKNVQWNRETISAILHNRPYVILQLSLLCDMVRQITYKSLPYLYDDIFEDFGMKAIVDMISGALSYAGLFAVPLVGKKVSARNMMVGGYSYTAIFYVIMSLFNFGKRGKVGDKMWVSKIRTNKWKWLIGICVGFAGMPNSAQGAARKIITADSTDYMEWYSYKNFGTAVRSDGMLTAFGSISNKVISLLKENLYNGLLSAVKYKSQDLNSTEKTVQENSTLRKLYLMITMCGLVGNTLAALAFSLDNYTGARKERIFAELCEMRESTQEKVNALEAEE